MAVELLYIVFTERGINPLGIRFGIGPKLTYGFEIRGSSSKGEDDVVRNNTVKLDPVKNKETSQCDDSCLLNGPWGWGPWGCAT